MTDIEKLLANGADSVGGMVVRRGKALAHWTGSEWVLTDEGVNELGVDDVVVKSEATKVEAAAEVPMALKRNLGGRPRKAV